MKMKIELSMKSGSIISGSFPHLSTLDCRENNRFYVDYTKEDLQELGAEINYVKSTNNQVFGRKKQLACAKKGDKSFLKKVGQNMTISGHLDRGWDLTAYVGDTLVSLQEVHDEPLVSNPLQRRISGTSTNLFEKKEVQTVFKHPLPG